MHVLFVCSIVRYHRAARKYVSRLTLITHDENLLPAAGNHSLYDKVIPATPAQISADHKYLSELAAREGQIDMVISIDEEYGESGTRIAQFLNVPFWPPPGVASIVNNKFMTRKVLKEHGLDNLPAQIISSAEQAMEFISSNGYPIVLKPLDCSGSSGVSKIESSREINEALDYLQQWAPGHEVLAEKFIEGKEFSVEAFSENGTHHAICVVEKFKSGKHFVGLGHRLPAPIDNALREKIISFVKNVLTALNIQNGPTHSEVIVANGGKEIALVETHLRAGGAKITTLIFHIWNINVIELWARQLFTGEAILPILRDAQPHHNCAVIIFHTPPLAGVLQQADATCALEVPGIVAAGNYASIGAVLKGYASNSGSRAAYAIALGNDPDKTLEQAKEAVQKIRFVIYPIQAGSQSTAVGTWYDQLQHINNGHELANYFNHHWKQAVSYYNVFSALLYQAKAKLRAGLPLDAFSAFKLTENGVLILQTGDVSPEFHLVAPKELYATLQTAERLKQISDHRITLHVPDFSPPLEQFVERRVHQQTVYDCAYIVKQMEHELAFGPGLLLNTRSRTTFKRNSGECTYRQVAASDEMNIRDVLKKWEQCALEKNKKIHLFKDNISIKWALKHDGSNQLAFIGFRKNIPVSYSFLIRLPGFHEFATQIISKSLNYKTAAAGYNETSVWELYNCCMQCLSEGIRYINASGHGNEAGLKK